MIPTMEMMLDLRQQSIDLWEDFSCVESWEWPSVRAGFIARAEGLRDAYTDALEACS